MNLKKELTKLVEKEVEDIKEKNKREYTGTREELIAEGYAPCGRCKP